MTVNRGAHNSRVVCALCGGIRDILEFEFAAIEDIEQRPLEMLQKTIRWSGTVARVGKKAHQFIKIRQSSKWMLSLLLNADLDRSIPSSLC
jgi:hypothetical protein